MSRVTGFSPAVHEQIRLRGNGGDDGYTEECCEGCGRWFPIEYKLVQHHHRRPRGSGGSKLADTNLASNGLALCAMRCHPWAESHRDEAAAKGWLISQHAKNVSPSSVPVLLHEGWHRFDNDGGRVPLTEEQTA